MIRTPEELASKIKSCKACLDKKFLGDGTKRSVVLCGGTGCLSSDSALIKEKFEEILKNKGLDKEISVNIVGCFGFCSQGPFVKIYPEDTLYRLVKINDVEEIVETYLINHQIV